MRLGKVIIAHEYVVDLDNKDMVDRAKESLREDIESMIKYDEVLNCSAVITKCKGLSKSDIPEFLLDQG